MENTETKIIVEKKSPIRIKTVANKTCKVCGSEKKDCLELPNYTIFSGDKYEAGGSFFNPYFICKLCIKKIAELLNEK